MDDEDYQPPSDQPLSVAVVDGRDALAYVIVRPTPTGGLDVEAASRGLSKAEAAYVLRRVASQWDPPPMNPDCVVGKHTSCAGDAWDDVNDERTTCGCDCHGGRGT